MKKTALVAAISFSLFLLIVLSFSFVADGGVFFTDVLGKVKRARVLTDAEINELIKTANDFSSELKEKGVDYQSKFYSRNTAPQVKNVLDNVKKRYEGNSEQAEFAKSVMSGALYVLFPGVQFDKKNIVLAVQESGVRKIIQKTESADGGSYKNFHCMAFAPQDNTWKVQSTMSMRSTDSKRGEAFARNFCYLLHPEIQDTDPGNFTEVKLNYSSEFLSAIYLNGRFIKMVSLGGGFGTEKLPLKKGKNILTVYLGPSTKSFVSEDDSAYGAIQAISGFSFGLTAGDKKLVELKVQDGTQRIEQQFDF